MDEIGLKQQFRKRALKGVDGCKVRLVIVYRIWRWWKPSPRQAQRQKQKQREMLLRRLQNQNRGQGKSKQHQKRGGQGKSTSPCFIPYLIGHNGQEIMSCTSPFDRRSYTLGCVREIPWHQITVVCQIGTCRPWILVLLPDFRVALLNPISGHEIALPGSPISSSDYELESPRLVLSLSQSHSSTPCYTVFIIFNSSKLLFFRKGDRVWTLLNLPWDLDCFNTSKGDLYALRASEGARYLLAVSTYTTQSTPTIEEFAMDTSQLPSPMNHEFFVHRLVESPNGEELLLVLEIIKLESGRGELTFLTIGFRVFTADLSGQMWIRKETLGDHVLIIIDKQTLFLSAASVGHGVKGNCIFFSGLRETGQNPLKMFDLDSEKVTDYPFSIPVNAGHFMFTPSPQQLNCSVVGTRINEAPPTNVYCG